MNKSYPFTSEKLLFWIRITASKSYCPQNRIKHIKMGSRCPFVIRPPALHSVSTRFSIWISLELRHPFKYVLHYFCPLIIWVFFILHTHFHEFYSNFGQLDFEPDILDNHDPGIILLESMCSSCPFGVS